MHRLAYNTSGIRSLHSLSAHKTSISAGTRSVRWRRKRYVSATPCRPFVKAVDHTVTNVEKILLDTIRATGPISYATYMQMCLSHPVYGYYMNIDHAVIGSRGDFTTSPEISQVFGELVGIWLLSQWLHTGASRKIRLIELGPGRGTLMKDILLTFNKLSTAKSAVKEIHLVETSPAMIRQQNASLAPFNLDIHWHSSLDAIPPDPTRFSMVVAHEFFDALPFHLIEKRHEGWHEVLIDRSPDSVDSQVEEGQQKTPLTTSLDLGSSPAVSLKPRFRQVLSPTPTASSTLLGQSSPRFQRLPVGTRLEISPAAFKTARRIAELLNPEDEGESGGCALIVDYGGDKAYGNSFRAFKDHKIVDVFHRPGECDLTANVDFQYLKDATADLVLSHGPLSQATFLKHMGIDVRVEALQKAAQSETRAKEIKEAAQRLVDLTGMGSQYKVMGLSGKTVQKVPPEARWPFLEVDYKTSQG
ncbi:S-adenosyl-L-methionine-dependent methyltransferase [Sparassis latifolia]